MKINVLMLILNKYIFSKHPCCTHRRSSRADRGARWVPDVSWHCPTAAAHTPAYCPETEMSAAATGEKQRWELYHVDQFIKQAIMGW